MRILPARRNAEDGLIRKLQVALSQAREVLARRGVLYPRGPVISRTHNFLMAGTDPQRLPRLYRQEFGERLGEIEPTFNAWVAEMKAAIAAKRPKAMILSGESLFRLRGKRRFDRLAGILRELGDTVDVVAYVRRPADHYLSSVQQVLRASHVIKPVAPVAYRASLENFAHRVADRMHVVKYDRAAFPEGDIVRHFLDTFVPEARDIGEAVDQEVNATISAEGMSVLSDYRRVIHSNRRNHFIGRHRPPAGRDPGSRRGGRWRPQAAVA